MENEAAAAKITAMEEAFSHLSVAADPFSSLPEQVFHCIFSFLPTTKEVARASVVSQQWLRAWRLYPVANFDIADFMAGSIPEADDQMEAQCCNFINFVDDTLMRIGRHNTGSESFNLTTVDWMAPHLSRWIHMALDNRVQKVTLRFLLKASSTDWVPCLLPIRVFSADSITMLNLIGPMIVLPLDEVSSVNLPSLTSLCLSNSAILDEQLQKILRGCPLLEHLYLCDCDSLSEIVILRSPNLKFVLASVSIYSAKLTLIRIKAPKLETFGYKCKSLFHRNVTVKVNHSPNLKYLDIHDENKTDKWFNQFLAKFPLLEFLKIYSCNALKRIRIPNPLLQQLSIHHCNNLKDILVEAKSVKFFNLIGMHTLLPELTIRMDDPVKSDVRIAAVCPYWDQMVNSNLFFKLQEFLMRSMTFGSSGFGFYFEIGPPTKEKVTVQVQAHKQFPTSAYKMEGIEIGVDAPEESYPFIMNGLLSTCHPTIVSLPISSEAFKLDFVKFLCEELAKKAPHNRKCCKGNNKCWKYQLKGVKVEGVTGFEHGEDLDLPTLINLVPNLRDDNAIRLRLEW